MQPPPARRSRRQSYVIAALGQAVALGMADGGMDVHVAAEDVDQAELREVLPNTIIVDGQRADAAAVVARAVTAAPTASVFLLCDGVDLPIVEAAFAAGARGLIAAGTEADAIPALMGRRDPELDAWREAHAP